jgi:fructose-specific component phosphotransferase system IIB-like protein
MRKNINTETIIGRVYQHDLKVKTVQNQNSDNFGKEFISGSLDVATDEDGLNVLTVHYTYVTETTKTGKKNSTYTALKKIIDEGKAWVVDGKDAATKVKVDTALALNDFYAQDDTLVSVKRNEGGFVTLVNELADISERNTFSVDMVITSVTKIEPTEENNVKEAYVSVRGAVFNFRNDLLPVDFVVRNAAGMKYFEDLDITSSEPVYTKVWGKIISMTDAREIKEESAFGEASVRTVERKTKEWVITGTAKIPYDFGDEEVLTADELTKAMQDREVHLAEVKKRSEEYRASKASSTPAAASASAPVAAKGNFSF